MTLRVQPDPQEPAGGFAFLELPGGTLPEGPVSVAILETYGDRWLAPSEPSGARVEIGNPNWQSERFDFGPYEVHRHDGADWVRIGPEIVNKLEEYTPLRLSVGPLSQDITWPDDVPPRAGAAIVGGIQTIARAGVGDAEDRLVGRNTAALESGPESGGETEAEAEQEALINEGILEPDPQQAGRRRYVIPLVLLALVVLALWAAWMFVLNPEETLEITEDTAPGGAACSLAALSALQGGFAVTEAAIRNCGRDVSPDTALHLIEEAAATEDPAALHLFGVLYDGETLDPRIENLVGLTFDDDPARAVEYYARAVQAGSEVAQPGLDQTCVRLTRSGATLAKGAFDDYCE